MRVKSTSAHKHRKILKLAKGYRMARSKRFKAANEAVLHAGQHAFIGRKLRKRDKRREWITQINAALLGLSMEKNETKLRYNQLIHGMKTHHIDIDRKILALLTIKDPQTFNFIVEQARTQS